MNGAIYLEEEAMPDVELSAGTIAYEDTGGEGPVVVFVHGLIMDGSLWRHVVEDLRADYRCVVPTLPLGGHRHPMRADADLSMRGIAEIAGEFIASLDLQDITLAMNDWGGAQLLIGGAHDARIARLALCACEAFDNVPPKGTAKALALHRAGARRDRRRADAVPLQQPAQAADDVRLDDQAAGPPRGDGPLVRAGARAARGPPRSAGSTCSARRRAAATCSPPPSRCRAFDRPALVAWASEDRLMPREHGHATGRAVAAGARWSRSRTPTR